MAISFWGIGATLGLLRFNRTEISKALFIILFVLYTLLITIEQFYMEAAWYGTVHRFDTMLGCIIVILISRFFVNRNIVINNQLTKCSFFLYCYHVLFLLIFSRLLRKMQIWNNEFASIASYLITPIIVVLVGLCIYNLMEKYTPKILRLISGGR